LDFPENNNAAILLLGSFCPNTVDLGSEAKASLPKIPFCLNSTALPPKLCCNNLTKKALLTIYILGQAPKLDSDLPNIHHNPL